MADTSHALDALRLIDINELSAITGLSRATLWRHHDEGRIPAGVKIGRAVRWRLTEIRDWLDAGCPRCGGNTKEEVRHGAEWPASRDERQPIRICGSPDIHIAGPPASRRTSELRS